MKKLKIWLYFIIPIVFVGCYSTEGISYNNEKNNILSNYKDNGVWDNELLSYYYNDKIFYVYLSSEIYFNVPFDRQLRDNYKYFTVFLQISSKVVLNNIKINTCEIEFNNYKIKFDNNDLKYYINQSYKENKINYEIIFSKNIKKDEYNKNILNVIKKNNEQKYISVEINLEYIENNEIFNYTFSNKLNTQYYKRWYTPSNLWGWLRVDAKYK
jgi:hypothetical protein